MNFKNYYLSERYATDKNERFLSIITKVENWQKIIETIVDAASRNNIAEDIVFLIKDPTKQFVINLAYFNGNFTYYLQDDSVEWLQEKNLTAETSKIGFYYDKIKDTLVINRNGEEFELPKTFKAGKQLTEFLNTLFIMNKYCKVRNGFALIYYLDFVDNLSKERADKIKQDPITPNWAKTIIKGDSSKRDSGLFSFLKR